MFDLGGETGKCRSAQRVERLGYCGRSRLAAWGCLLVVDRDRWKNLTKPLENKQDNLFLASSYYTAVVRYTVFTIDKRFHILVLIYNQLFDGV